MPDLLVRNIDETTIAHLKEQAHLNERSLKTELRMILEQTAKQVAMTTTRALAEQMSRSLKNRTHTDSAELLRENRDR